MGDPAVCRGLGRHRADHLVLVLAVLLPGHILNTVTELGRYRAADLERSVGVTAVAFSDGRRTGARLVTGPDRGFCTSAALAFVHVPHPVPDRRWSRRTLSCGVALQCAPSKERLAEFRLGELSAAELRALTLVEGGVALGWIAGRWPGLLDEIRRWLPDIAITDPDMDAAEMLRRAVARARSGRVPAVEALLGRLPLSHTEPAGLGERARRRFGRMPWTTTQQRLPRRHSVPVGGDGGVRNPNLPPPSRPEDDDAEVSPGYRPGIPYPEWNTWTNSFLRDHVAVLERKLLPRNGHPAEVPADLRKWFSAHTHRAMTGRLEDGSDLDVDAYVRHRIGQVSGPAGAPRVFRDLLPGGRDVSTALLLDGSSSLGVHGGRVFRLELACADALSRAMALARERHGIFVFTGNTRHRVEVQCLKDFEDVRSFPPGSAGLVTGGYTRLGAPLRHLTTRLLKQPGERRLLIAIGDGLVSDQGYEGRYAWADAAHAVQEAEDAGVSMYYIGVGPTRVDPLPEVFGDRRSQRIRTVEELPRVLAHVHRHLVAG